MPEHAYAITCQRCGTPMDMRDPAPDMPWAPQQFWVCTKCGRHFWTTYATATPAPPKKEEGDASASAAPKKDAVPATPATPKSQPPEPVGAGS